MTVVVVTPAAHVVAVVTPVTRIGGAGGEADRADEDRGEKRHFNDLHLF
jgi:hypothetical protein